MADQSKKIQETVSDLQEIREKLKGRHSDNVSLSLRLESSLTSMIGSLGSTLGGNPDYNAFVPTPIEVLAGTVVSGNKDASKVMEDAEIKAFKDNVQATYEGFVGRDNHDISTGVDEETLRAVAKKAGMEDYKTAKVDATYIESVKEAIQEKNKVAADRAAEKAKIKAEGEAEKGGDAPVLSVAEKTALKKAATAEYTELFGEAPASNLSSAKIQELIDAKKAEDNA